MSPNTVKDVTAEQC